MDFFLTDPSTSKVCAVTDERETWVGVSRAKEPHKRSNSSLDMTLINDLLSSKAETNLGQSPPLHRPDLLITSRKLQNVARNDLCGVSSPTVFVK